MFTKTCFKMAMNLAENNQVKYLSAPEWIYVPLILLGVFSGLYSMVRFILGAMKSLDRLEEQHRRDDNKK